MPSKDTRSREREKKKSGKRLEMSSLPNIKKIVGSLEWMANDDPLKMIRIKMGSTLLENNLNLLAAICQCTFVGDRASTVCNSIISLLKQLDEYSIEIFIKRILRAKIFIYTSKMRKIADLLRDNSISTLILTLYVKSSSEEFLKKTFESPFNEVGKLFEAQFEDQIPNAEKDKSEVLDENEAISNQNILKACNILLSAILRSYDEMPREFRTMCRYLKTEIENRNVNEIINWYEENNDCYTSQQDIDKIQNYPESMVFGRRLSYFVKKPDFFQPRQSATFDSTASSPVDVSFPDRYGLLADTTISNDESKLKQDKPSRNNSQRSSLYQMRGSDSALLQSETSKISVTTSFSTKKDHISTNQEDPGIEEHTHITSVDKPNEDAQDKLKRINLPEIQEELDAAQDAPKDSSHDEKNKPNVSIQIEPTNNENNNLSDNGDTDTGSFLTESQRVVGTFIFLRFFVPAIITPETHDLLRWKMEKNHRKALTQVGKVLNAFFSEVSPKSKEPEFSEFIEFNKYGVREFVNLVCRELPKSTEIFHNNGKSLEELAETIAKKRMIEAEEYLVSSLLKSEKILDQDIRKFSNSVPSDQSNGVLEQWESLRNELEWYRKLNIKLSEATLLSRIRHKINVFQFLGKKRSFSNNRLNSN